MKCHQPIIALVTLAFLACAPIAQGREEEAHSSQEKGKARGFVTEKDPQERFLAREVFKSRKEALPDESKSLQAVLENGDWFCSVSDHKAETGSSLVEEKLKDPKVRGPFLEHLKKSEEGAMRAYEKTLDEAQGLGKDYPLQLLSQARANGHLYHPLGVLGYRVLAMDPESWLEDSNKSIASFFAENVLKASPKLDEKKKATLEAELTEKNKKERIPALFRLALSEDPKTRELYSQIVLSLSESQIEELKKFIEEHKLGANSPSACTALRLSQVITKSPDFEKALKIPELSSMIMRRVVQQNPAAIAETLKENPALESSLMPHLFQMRDKKDKHLPKVIEALSPKGREIYEGLSPYLPETQEKQELNPLPKSEGIPEKAQRIKKIDMTTVAGMAEALENPNWECTDKEFISPRRTAQETLLKHKDLRDLFIDSQKERSKKQFSKLLSHYKQGELSNDELMSQLHDFEAKFYVTAEASKARKLLINLETDETVKKLRKEVDSDIDNQLSGGQGRVEEGLGLGTEDILPLFANILSDDPSRVQKYRKLVMTLPTKLQKSLRNLVTDRRLFAPSGSQSRIIKEETPACWREHLPLTAADALSYLDLPLMAMAESQEGLPPTETVVKHVLTHLEGPDRGRSLLIVSNWLNNPQGLTIPDEVGEELEFLNSAKGLKFPEPFNGNINLNGLTSATGLKLPESVGGSLRLSNIASADGLKLPKAVGGSLHLYGLTSAEGLVLPTSVGGSLYLYGLTSAEGLTLPESVGDSINLSKITSADGLKFPKSVGGDLRLTSLTSAEGLVLPRSVGGVLDLTGLTSAKGLKLPKSVTEIVLPDRPEFRSLKLPPGVKKVSFGTRV